MSIDFISDQHSYICLEREKDLAIMCRLIEDKKRNKKT